MLIHMAKSATLAISAAEKLAYNKECLLRSILTRFRKAQNLENVLLLLAVSRKRLFNQSPFSGHCTFLNHKHSPRALPG
jgi:hypothetical protein